MSEAVNISAGRSLPVIYPDRAHIRGQATTPDPERHRLRDRCAKLGWWAGAAALPPDITRALSILFTLGLLAAPCKAGGERTANPPDDDESGGAGGSAGGAKADGGRDGDGGSGGKTPATGG